MVMRQRSSVSSRRRSRTSGWKSAPGDGPVGVAETTGVERLTETGITGRGVEYEVGYRQNDHETLPGITGRGFPNQFCFSMAVAG